VIYEGENLLYNAPCSGGKTLVADILMIRKVLSTRKRCLYIVPYISIVNEKVKKLGKLLEGQGVTVSNHSENNGGYIGEDLIAVCTIEKANILLQKMIEASRVQELCCVIVDEIHLIAESKRGTTLESILSKLKFLAPTIQIIAMSATIPNIGQLAEWLGAYLFVTDFRPVPVQEFLKKKRITTIEKRKLQEDYLVNIKSKKETRIVRPDHLTVQVDPNCIHTLTRQTTKEGGGVLIFCISRENCEETAKMALQLIQLEGVPLEQCVARNEICDQVLDQNLKELIKYGIAYHHAGLYTFERDLIETAFSQGIIHTLPCTTTLAAGVNLPARRVIFNGVKNLDAIRYQQAAGRAGRMNLDKFGDSIIITHENSTDNAAVEKILNPMSKESLKSGFFDSDARCKILLEMIGNGWIHNSEEAVAFLMTTLFGHQSLETLQNVANQTISILLSFEMIVKEENKYMVTKMGNASIVSTLTPDAFRKVWQETNKILLQGMSLSSPLHILYLSVLETDQQISWDYMKSIMRRPSQEIEQVIKFLDVDPHYMDTIQIRHRGDDITRECVIYKKIYLALILQQLIKEIPMDQVAKDFGIARGAVQAIQKNATHWASTMHQFLGKLGLWHLQAMFEKMKELIHYGVDSDLLDLMKLNGMTALRARMLYKSGIQSTEMMAKASFEDVTRILGEVGMGDKFAIELIQCAKKIVSTIEANGFSQFQLPTKRALPSNEVLENPIKKVKQETISPVLTVLGNVPMFCFVVFARMQKPVGRPMRTKYVLEGIVVTIPGSHWVIEDVKLIETILALPTPKYTCNFKEQWKMLHEARISCTGVLDLAVADWLVRSVDDFDEKKASKVKKSETTEPLQQMIAKRHLKQYGQKKNKNPNIQDCLDILELYKVLNPLLIEMKQETTFQTECKVVSILAEMEFIGILLDFTEWLSHEDYVTNKLSQIENRANRIHPINLQSPKDIAKVLYDKLNLPAGKFTDWKHRTTEGGHLETIASLDRTGMVDLILLHRSIHTIDRDCKDVKRCIEPHGPMERRIHTTYLQFSSCTGRISTVNPGTQTIHKDLFVEEDNATIALRKAFIASTGHVLLSADYSAIELRMIAHYSRETELSKLFDKEEDVFFALARIVLNKKDVTSEDRALIKRSIYGILYSMGTITLANANGVRREVAVQIIERFHLKFPKVKSYMKDAIEMARQCGYITSLTGRRRYIHNLNAKDSDLRSTAERKVLNSIMQGSVADIVKYSMIEIRKHKIRMIHHLHDEIIMEIKMEDLESKTRFVKETMQNVVKLSIPLVVKTRSGPNWGDLK
jgi:replicative superfamily II helicase/DNA polymerase I-like protein with 3'-5' exonuclease and polymerase domains